MAGIAHHELVDCLRFIIIVCSVPAGDADTEAVVLCRVAPSALSTVTSRYLCISIGMGDGSGSWCEKKLLTNKVG